MRDRLIAVLRGAYRRVAGPNASLSDLPRWVLRRVVGPDITIRLRGKPFTLNLNDAAITGSLLFSRTYEPCEEALMRRLVSPGDVALDVGANVGFFTALMGELVGPQGRVIAFEPQPNNARILAKNVADRGLASSVKVVDAAAGDAAGTATLVLGSPANMGDFRVRRNGNKTAAYECDVPVVRIDDAVGNVPHVDFIKMDVQGFELFALDGMRATLERNPGIVLLTEFWPYGLRGADSDPAAYLAALRRLGFRLWEIDEERPELTELAEEDDRLLIQRLDPVSFVNLLCARTPEAVLERVPA